jgi:hypothetical protein
VTGNWIVVGAYFDDNANGNDAGAVFVFTKTSTSSPSSWTQLTQLLASNGTGGDYFGKSVSISKDASTIVVGADFADFNSTITDSGAAYIFQAINSTTTTTTSTTMVEWTQMGKFVAASRESFDHLGRSIAIENNIVVVGASGDDSYTGSVYVVDTGFSSLAPSTAAPDSGVTPEPTVVPTPDPTMPSSLENDSGSTPQLPMTNSPTSTFPLLPTTTTNPSSSGIDTDPANSPMTNNSTIQPPEQPNSDSKTVFSPGVIVGMSAMVCVVIIVLGIAFFNYRIKIQREKREQQQQTNETATHIMADAVVLVVPPPGQEAHDETLEADAFLDPSTVDATAKTAAAAAAAAAAAITNPTEKKLPRYKDQVTAAAAAAASITNSTEKELPRYKDQVRAVEPLGLSIDLPSLSMENCQLQNQDNHQEHQYQEHQCPEEEKEEGIEDQPPVVQPQQQILHPDPPAAINYQKQHHQLPSYKDRVDL